MTDSYELEIDLDEPVDRVWHALTDARTLEQWFCEHADIDLDAGRFDFWGRHTPRVPTPDEGRGRIIDVDPMRLLRFNWGGTTVTFTLDGSTRVRVLHEDVAARPTPAEHLPAHWWGFALGHLRALLATGPPGPRFDWSWPHVGGFTAPDLAAPADLVWDGLVSGWITPNNFRRPRRATTTRTSDSTSASSSASSSSTWSGRRASPWSGSRSRRPCCPTTSARQAAAPT